MVLYSDKLNSMALFTEYCLSMAIYW